ncbi:MAG: hypothetical protein K0S88_217 [Actinomycetia bacterium]|nr:hypothetical protein [Actinomycetes bacterium]
MTRTEAANTCACPAGVPASSPTQPSGTCPPMMRSTSVPHGRATSASRSARARVGGPSGSRSGHQSTPSCRIATTHLAPCERSSRASGPTRSPQLSAGAGALLNQCTCGWVSPITPSAPAPVSTIADPGNPTSRFAQSSGYGSTRVASNSAGTPSSNSWFPAAAASIGRSPMSAQGRVPSSGYAGPTVKSPASTQTVGCRSRSASSSSTTPAQVPPSP